MALESPVVLGIPRGGVIVAAEVARMLGAPLDVALVSKLRHPNQPELAIGAIGEDGGAFLHEETAADVTEDAIFREERDRLEKLRSRARAYRAARAPVDVAGRIVILVDDGVATGSTMAAAARLMRAHGPARLVIALPVAAEGAVESLRGEADEIVCIHTPQGLHAVCHYYESFYETRDDDVVAALAASVAG